MFRRIALALLVVLVAGVVIAGERGTRDEATSLVDQGFTLLEEKGVDELIRIVNLREAPFTDRDLYLFVIDPDGHIVAHGYDESRIGLHANDLYDGDGQPYGSLFLKLADEKGRWLDYRTHDPLTGKTARKSTLVRKKRGYILGCGVYY